MKAVSFGYSRAEAVSDAIDQLGRDDDAVLLAGGQSLLPMMNFRVARPSALVDLGGILELQQISMEDGAVRFGAMVTHARIEDGVVPGQVGMVLAGIARGIAFRAIRNRGTVGGSVAQADPAADWPVALCCLDAEVVVVGPQGERRLPIREFILGPMETALEPGEVIIAFVVRNDAAEQFGWSKSVRKAGEFAEAIAAVRRLDGIVECWIGALGGPPCRIEVPSNPALFVGDEHLTGSAEFERLKSAIAAAVPEAAAYRVHLAALNVCRALGQSHAAEPIR